MDNLLFYAAIQYAEDTTRESPGHIRGVLVTYGEQAKDRPDVYDAGSLSWPSGGIVVLNEMHDQHDRRSLIKRFTPYLDGCGLLRVDFPLPSTTQRGRDAAQMVQGRSPIAGSAWRFRGIAS